MSLVRRLGLAACAALVLAGAASISDGPHGVNYVAYSLLALTSFGLTLSEGSDMGFVFVILALRQLNWSDTMLMGGASLFIQSVVRRNRSTPQSLLRALASTGLAVLLSQAVFHAPQLHSIDESGRFMIASLACFVGYNFRGLHRMNFWAFPYYPVAAAIAALLPASVILVPAVFLTWRSYRLYARRLEKQCEQTRKISDLYMRTVETLALAIEAKDQPMSGRSRRVQVYCAELARLLHLPDAEKEALRAAALLYDIGELAIPEHIMLKPSGLTSEEFEKVKIHPSVGAEILERVRFPHPVAPIVRAHHERWDGTGYPDALSGLEIPIGARILSAVDALDALASPRVHRPALRMEEAVQKLQSERGGAFDPEIVGLIATHYRKWEPLVVQSDDGYFIDSIFEAQREAQVVQELSSALGRALDTESTFAATRKALRQLLPFHTAVLWLKNADLLEPVFVDGDSSASWSTARIPLGQGLSGLAAATAQPQQSPNPARELGFLATIRQVRSFRHVLSVPLRSGELTGAITLYRAGDLPFGSDDIRLLSTITPRVASALTKSRRFDAINQVDLSDPLTGLPNSKALASRMQTLEAPTAVVVCDLDGFKGVNDRFGHLTGNRLLESVAKAFQSGCRGNDFVARTGGDEFVLVLPGLRRHEIGPRLEQFREMVRITGHIVCGEDSVDASFGSAVYPTDSQNPDELLSKADANMYRRKAEQKAGVIPLRPSRSA